MKIATFQKKRDDGRLEPGEIHLTPSGSGWVLREILPASEDFGRETEHELYTCYPSTFASGCGLLVDRLAKAKARLIGDGSLADFRREFAALAASIEKAALELAPVAAAEREEAASKKKISKKALKILGETLGPPITEDFLPYDSATDL